MIEQSSVFIKVLLMYSNLMNFVLIDFYSNPSTFAFLAFQIVFVILNQLYYGNKSINK